MRKTLPTIGTIYKTQGFLWMSLSKEPERQDEQKKRGAQEDDIFPG